MNGILKSANGDSNSDKSCMNFKGFTVFEKYCPAAFCGQNAGIISS
jgi:hypothetical protein